MLYDDEPRNMKELIAHPERAEIQKAGDDEIQQLIDQQIGVIVPKSEVDEFLKNGGKVLNAKMLFKRKYEIVDGVQRFKKWKGRLAVVGTGEIRTHRLPLQKMWIEEWPNNPQPRSMRRMHIGQSQSFGSPTAPPFIQKADPALSSKISSRKWVRCTPISRPEGRKQLYT